MTRFEKILEICPLSSYEEDRAINGNVQFIRETEQRKLCPGVTYRKRLYQRGNGADVWVYISEIAPDAQAQLAVSACPLHTIKHVKQHAADFDGEVLFAMNAGFFRFFNNGDLTPRGIQVMRGVIMADPGRDDLQYSHFFLGVQKNGTPLISNTDEYEAGLKKQLEYAVGGGMQLIRDGKVFLHKLETLAPRTAVAVAYDGTAILLCCDGRSQKSAGLSYADMIDIYLNLGYEIKDMLNLDGGGSTAVVLKEADGRFIVQNVPSGPPTPDAPAVEPHGEEQARPVADAVLIIKKPD